MDHSESEDEDEEFNMPEPPKIEDFEKQLKTLQKNIRAKSAASSKAQAGQFISLGILLTVMCLKIKKGVITFAQANSILASAGGIAMAPFGILGLLAHSLLYTVHTGLAYRKMKQGKITKKEFSHIARSGAVGQVGQMIGAGMGGGIGFIIGTLVFPVFGSTIGVIIGASMGVMVGGITGAKCGRKFSLYLFAKLEGKMYKLQVLASKKSYQMMLAT